MKLVGSAVLTSFVAGPAVVVTSTLSCARLAEVEVTVAVPMVSVDCSSIVAIPPEAAFEVAAQAQRSLTIMTPDLEPGVYDHEDFLEIVKRLVLAKRYARVRVLVTDPSRTVRNGNRLVALGRRLNTYIDFRNLHERYRTDIHPAYIIADESAVLYRANGRRYEGIMGRNEPAIARQHLDAFEQPWEESDYSKDIRMAHT